MIKILEERLRTYTPTNAVEEEHALKEILQEIALYGLWQADFFDVGAFQGGTSLRILHGLPRFSEDLDFILKEPDADFSWETYFKKMHAVFEQFGLVSQIVEKGRMDQRIRKALLKNNSIGRQLNLSFYRTDGRPKQYTIKMEIDVDPPAGSVEEYIYLDFPLDFEVCCQDLSSNFALKIHALLCRPYCKGRDWFDFSWYVAREISPNLRHLQAALLQWGPWAGKNSLSIDIEWLKKSLAEKITTIDWQKAAADVENFLKPVERESLKLWSERFFLHKTQKLGQR